MYDEYVSRIRKAAGEQELEESPQCHAGAEGIAGIQDVACNDADDIAGGIGPVHPEPCPSEREDHGETEDCVDNADAAETNELVLGAMDFAHVR